jgi:hypothetical protein
MTRVNFIRLIRFHSRVHRLVAALTFPLIPLSQGDISTLGRVPGVTPRPKPEIEACDPDLKPRMLPMGHMYRSVLVRSDSGAAEDSRLEVFGCLMGYDHRADEEPGLPNLEGSFIAVVRQPPASPGALKNAYVYVWPGNTGAGGEKLARVIDEVRFPRDEQGAPASTPAANVIDSAVAEIVIGFKKERAARPLVMWIDGVGLFREMERPPAKAGTADFGAEWE